MNLLHILGHRTRSVTLNPDIYIALCGCQITKTWTFSRKSCSSTKLFRFYLQHKSLCLHQSNFFHVCSQWWGQTVTLANKAMLTVAFPSSPNRCCMAGARHGAPNKVLCFVLTISRAKVAMEVTSWKRRTRKYILVLFVAAMTDTISIADGSLNYLWWVCCQMSHHHLLYSSSRKRLCIFIPHHTFPPKPG